MKKCITSDLKEKNFCCNKIADQKVVVSDFSFSESGHLIDKHKIIYTCLDCKKRLDNIRKDK